VENRASVVTNVVIMGAAGRDFHNFNVVFRANPNYRVVTFTAAQIPNIVGRTYPPELAGVLAAKRHGAAALVDPRAAVVGSLRETFRAYPHLDCLLPTMGYGADQIHDLEQTINRVDCDVVVRATPVDLRRLITIRQPSCLVRYEFEDTGGKLRGILMNALANRGKQGQTF
jgi:predicted GTPase